MVRLRVSPVWRHSPNDTASGHAHLLVWVEGHADLTASETFLKRHTNKEVRPMARPVRLEWDSHDWLEAAHSYHPKHQRTDPSTVNRDGNVPSGEL
jgi:hypothetical protein